VAITLNDALAIISSFSTKYAEILSAGKYNSYANGPISEALIKEVNKVLPPELVEYIDLICPQETLIVEGVGHPVELLKRTDLAWKPSLLSGLTGELAQWQDDWLLIAHEGGDPIIVNTSEQGDQSTVYSAMQGMGVWDFAPIADSLGQFLVCIFAIQHGLNFPGLSEPLDEDFNLAPAAANWLFPFLREYAGAYYEEWASVFENYQMD